MKIQIDWHIFESNIELCWTWPLNSHRDYAIAWPRSRDLFHLLLQSKHWVKTGADSRHEDFIRTEWTKKDRKHSRDSRTMKLPNDLPLPPQWNDQKRGFLRFQSSRSSLMSACRMSSRHSGGQRRLKASDPKPLETTGRCCCLLAGSRTGGKSAGCRHYAKSQQKEIPVKTKTMTNIPSQKYRLYGINSLTNSAVKPWYISSRLSEAHFFTQDGNAKCTTFIGLH